MSTQGSFAQSIIRANFRDVSPEQFSIYPQLAVLIEITLTIPAGQPNYNVQLSDWDGTLRIRTPDGNTHLVGYPDFKPALMTLGSGAVQQLRAIVTLDHFGLAVIERLRAGGNLDLMLSDFACNAQIVGQPGSFQSVYLNQMQMRVPKSDWVERHLPTMNYKDVVLVEMPKIDGKGFEQAAAHLNSAWKEYASGKYDHVLSDCRKALEATKKIAKDLNLIEVDGEDRIDFKKVSGGDATGDIISAVFQKTWAFTTPGAHTGRTINREDADFALLLTHAMVNFVSERSNPK